MKTSKLKNVLMAVILVLSLMLTACSGGDRKDAEGGSENVKTENGETSTGTEASGEQTQTEAADSVMIYYVNYNGQSAVPSVLTGAKEMIAERLGEDFTVETKAFSTYADILSAMETGEVPDLIVVDEFAAMEGLDVMALVEKGTIHPFTSYLLKDEADGLGSQDEYLGGVLEAGQIGGEQYMLPLSVRTDYMMATTEKLSGDNALAALGSEYSLTELMEAISREYEQTEGSELTWTLAPFSNFLMDIGSLTDSFLEGNGLLSIDLSAGTWNCDKESFNAGIRYMRSFIGAYYKMYGDNAGRSEDLDVMESRFLAVTSNMNLPYITRYYQSSFHQMADKDIDLIFYPLADSQGAASYGVTVNSYMVMTKPSLEAYETAYCMNHTSADVWSMLKVGDLANIYTSPIKSVFAEEVELGKTLTGGSYKFITNSKTVSREDLEDRLADQMMNWMENVTIAHIMDYRVTTILKDVYQGYITGGSALDLDTAFEDFSARMNEIFQ